MSVTRDHSLKLCLHFPAFILFYWQSICRVVWELKSCQVNWVKGIAKKNNNNNKKKMNKWKRSFSLFGQFHRIPSIPHTLLVCFKRGNLSKSYCGYQSFLPLEFAPLFVLALFRLFISSECFMIRNWPLYNHFLKPYNTYTIGLSNWRSRQIYHYPKSLKGIVSYCPKAQRVGDCLRLYFFEQTFYFSADRFCTLE